MKDQIINILGVKINNITFLKTLEKIGDYLNNSTQHYVVTPNPEIILKAQKDDYLKNILNNADLSLPDGMGLLPASKFKIKQRVTGSDVMLQTLALADKKKLRVLFIINQNGLTSIEQLEKVLNKKFPNLESLIIYKSQKKYIEISPDIIFVALGCPAQERWIQEHRKKFPSSKLIMTVGGGVDFLSGTQKRAPKFIRTIGLEWLWRLIKQPNRIKRIFMAVLVFPLKVYFS